MPTAIGHQQQPAAAHNTRTIRANLHMSGLKSGRSFDGAARREPGLRTSGACPEMSWAEPGNRHDRVTGCRQRVSKGQMSASVQQACAS
jgi:hypothetical protein